MREADIRPADLLDEYLRLSEDDARRFFADRASRAHRTCPGCGDDRPQRAFDKRGFTLVRCDGCETLYVNPAPESSRLDAFYRSSPSSAYWANVFFPAVAEARRKHVFAPRAELTLSIAARHDVPVRSVIDVGAGAGLYLEELARRAPHVAIRAVEPGEDLARCLRDKHIETFQGFADEAAAVWAGRTDMVTCFEVIEHVLDPRALLAALGALAAPGGLIVVSGLCGSGFDIEALGSHSKAIVPPHHLNFISRAGVDALVRRAGLDLVEFLTPGKLDVDIVVNALAANPLAVADAGLRRTLLAASDEERHAMQERIAAEGRSSHMWIIARRRRTGR